MMLGFMGVEAKGTTLVWFILLAVGCILLATRGLIKISGSRNLFENEQVVVEGGL